MNKLREMREELGLSRATLSKLTGGVVTESVVSRIENEPEHKILVREAEALVAALLTRRPGTRRQDVFASGLLVNDWRRRPADSHVRA